jgi:glycosyltransferase involved in cell wall biosynthesis
VLAMAGRLSGAPWQMTLRVVHLSHKDLAGGAARCAHRLHRGLRALHHDSHMLVAHRDSEDPSISRVTPADTITDRLRGRLRALRIRRDFDRYRSTRPSWPELFSDDRARYEVEAHRRVRAADVVNLHWIAGLVDYRRFFGTVAGDLPVVWTLHDMNAFTGGCHYDAGCGRFKARCGACPQLGSQSERDLSGDIWTRKNGVFGSLSSESLHIVTPSRWLADEVRRSSIFNDRFPVSVIPYGLDTDDFAPRDRAVARQVLGIPQDAKVVLFVAQAVGVRRKGFALLAEALESMQDVPGLFLLSLGSGRPTIRASIRHSHFRSVSDDRLLSLIYSAADVFVVPSLEDNLPATVLEALACGTPVAGFDIGGIPDMVRPGVTGSLASAGDVKGLRRAILDLLQDDEGRREMGASCRRIAEDEYRLDIQARRYEALYEQLLADRAPGLRSPVSRL